MKANVLITILLIVIATAAVVVFFANRNSNGGDTEQPQGGAATTSVPIASEFENKIVYTSDQSVDTAPLIADCEARGGTFNQCGSICGPDAAVCAEVCAYTCEGLGGTEAEIDTSAWEQFENETYSFSLSYSADDWSVYTSTSSEFSPKFNIYQKPAGVPLDLPLDHLANVNYVAVFPLGVPTEGLFGETRPLEFDPEFPVSDESRMYVLEDGTPFAAYVKPAEPPESWNDSGFIWMRLRVENLESECLREGAPVGEEECDPLVVGDEIVRSGSVGEGVWEVEQAMVRSLTLASVSSTTDMIQLSAPAENVQIESPLVVEGEARGPWYFEASFPVVLTDWDGRIIAEGFAEAEGEWMTEDWVPFSGTLNFESPYGAGDPEFMQNGSLILRKANPSGLPENDAAYEMPVRFAPGS